MDRIAVTARQIYVALNGVPEETFDQQPEELQTLYVNCAQAVVDTVAEQIRAEATAGDDEAPVDGEAAPPDTDGDNLPGDAGDDSVQLVAGGQLEPEPVSEEAPAREPAPTPQDGGSSPVQVGDLQVHLLENGEQFVAGTTDVDLAAGAVMNVLIGQVGEADFFTSHANTLVTSVTTVSTRWELAGGTVREADGGTVIGVRFHPDDAAGTGAVPEPDGPEGAAESEPEQGAVGSEGDGPELSPLPVQLGSFTPAADFDAIVAGTAGGGDAGDGLGEG